MADSDEFVRILIQHVRKESSGFKITNKQTPYSLKTSLFTTDEVKGIVEGALQDRSPSIEDELRDNFGG